jgi:hypothetical protein
MIPPTCHVVRDGTIKTAAAADLVKGDIVLLVRRCTYSLRLLLLPPSHSRGVVTKPQPTLSFSHHPNSRWTTAVLLESQNPRNDSPCHTGHNYVPLKPRTWYVWIYTSGTSLIRTSSQVFNSTLIVNGEAWGGEPGWRNLVPHFISP